MWRQNSTKKREVEYSLFKNVKKFIHNLASCASIIRVLAAKEKEKAVDLSYS